MFWPELETARIGRRGSSEGTRSFVRRAVKPRFKLAVSLSYFAQPPGKGHQSAPGAAVRAISVITHPLYDVCPAINRDLTSA